MIGQYAFRYRREGHEALRQDFTNSTRRWGNALILRRGKNYEKSLDLYTQAAAAAEQHAGPMEQAGWIAKQGNIYRLMGCIPTKRAVLLQSQGDVQRVGEEWACGSRGSGGTLGLLASDGGDGRTAEKLYRRAVELAADARSSDLINTWATNLAPLSRQRRYRGWGFYKAMAAALKMNDQSSIRDAAVRWSVSYRRAHRNKDAADLLITASNHMEDVATQYELLHDAAARLQVAVANGSSRPTLPSPRPERPS